MDHPMSLASPVLRGLVAEHFPANSSDITPRMRAFIHDVDTLLEKIVSATEDHRANMIKMCTVAVVDQQRRRRSSSFERSKHTPVQVAEKPRAASIHEDQEYQKKLSQLRDDGVISGTEYEECVRKHSDSGSTRRVSTSSASPPRKTSFAETTETIKPGGRSGGVLSRYQPRQVVDPIPPVSTKRLSTSNISIKVSDIRGKFADGNLQTSANSSSTPGTPASRSMGSAGIAAKIKQYLDVADNPDEGDLAKPQSDEPTTPGGTPLRLVSSEPVTQEITIPVGSATFKLEDLLNDSETLVAGIDMSRRELYLDDDEFFKVFHMTKSEFAEMPLWKRKNRKQSVDLF